MNEPTNEPTNEDKFEQEVNDNVVHSDSDIAKSQHGLEVYVKILLKERRAIYKEAKALGKATPVAEEPALELWEEMPQAAKEFEAFDSDEDSAV